MPSFALTNDLNSFESRFDRNLSFELFLISFPVGFPTCLLLFLLSVLQKLFRLMRSESQLIETHFIFSVLTIAKRNFLLKLNSTFLKMPVMIRMECKGHTLTKKVAVSSRKDRIQGTNENFFFSHFTKKKNWWSLSRKLTNTFLVIYLEYFLFLKIFEISSVSILYWRWEWRWRGGYFLNAGYYLSHIGDLAV